MSMCTSSSMWFEELDLEKNIIQYGIALHPGEGGWTATCKDTERSVIGVGTTPREAVKRAIKKLHE